MYALEYSSGDYDSHEEYIIVVSQSYEKLQELKEQIEHFHKEYWKTRMNFSKIYVNSSEYVSYQQNRNKENTEALRKFVTEENKKIREHQEQFKETIPENIWKYISKFSYDEFSLEIIEVEEI